MNGLVIGKGEVGTSLYNVLKKAHENTFIRDIEHVDIDGFVEVMHIAYPQNDSFDFIQSVIDYANMYKPTWIVIHSTVKAGTTRLILEDLVGVGVYHSPIRGVHPNLEDGIETFEKFISGTESKIVTDYFSKANIDVLWCDKYEETELMKLLSTTYYGWNIAFCKEVAALCEQFEVDFDKVYTAANHTYNKGYIQLGRPDVIRPVLKPVDGKIGGHCVIPNAVLLRDVGFSPADDLIKYNDSYEEPAS